MIRVGLWEGCDGVVSNQDGKCCDCIHIQMDFKKKYIVKCIEALLCLNEEPEELVQSEKLEEFVNSNQVHALVILYRPGKKLKVAFPEDDFPLNSNILMATIIKLNLEVNSSNLADSYNISLTTADCLRNFASDLAKAYLPALSQRNQNLRGLMTGIKKTIANQQELYFDAEDINVETPADQFNLWKRTEEAATSSDQKKKAQYFQDCYKEIQKGWQELEALDHKGLKELIEATFAALDDIWGDKYPYNAKRFANLVKCFTATLWRFMTAQVPKVNSEAKTKIAMVEDLTKTWIKLLEEYRDVNWRTKAFPYAERTSNYLDKIEDVKGILVLFDEIRFIKERINLDIDLVEIQELFANTVPLSTNPVLARSWNKAKKVFLNVLESKAFALSTYFKENVLSTSKANKKPLKLLQQMHRWNALLNLQSIKNTLKQEKKQIFKIISNHLDKTKQEFQSRTGQSIDPIPGKDKIPIIKNFSPFLCAILYGRKIQDKVKRTLTYSEQIFKGLNDLQNMKYQIDAFLKDMQGFQNDQLNKWKAEMAEAEYSDQGLGMQMNGKMMNLDLNTSTLTVNYSDRLILLIRETRQLAELGLKGKVPQEIIDTAEQGKRYYKEALSLKKIANFYNNMNQEIIDSQKAMVLKQLQNFQECVRNVNSEMKAGGELTWDKPANVEKYIESLNKATNRLVKQNSRLNKIHGNIIDIIIQLSNHDLRKDKNIWMSKLQQIKGYVESACLDKDPKYCRKWKTHCDVQLYKVMQMQFLTGLEDSDTVLPQINVEVLLKNKQIQFKPSIEELKDKYYREITNFITWPSRVFRGIIGNLEIYQKLGDRNGLAIKSLISKAESTFTMLQLHLKNLESWGSIPYLSVTNINERIKTIQEWEFNIRVIRLKRKELEKVPDYQKVECFNINQIKFKNSSDELISDFLEKMMNSLKESVIAETKEVNTFLFDSLARLNKKSTTLEQTQQNKSTYLQIKMRQKQMKKKFDEIIMKKKWILQATGYNHDTDQMQQNWEEFTNKVMDYDNLLAEQIEHLKGLVDSRAKEIQAEMNKYMSKTSSIHIPANRTEVNELLDVLKALKEEQTKLVDKIKKLKGDCQQFELPIPNITLKQMEWQQWEMLEQYCLGLKTHEQQLFVKMKTEKMYAFQDFCIEWSEKVKGKEMSRQIVYIIKETDLFKTLFSLLKTLSSGILEREHWKQFWTIIKSERSLAAESVKLGDMLNQGRSLLEKQVAIQDLISRAQGESTLREALQQLAIWWETAEFQFTIYEGKKNKCPLIKEWKQMTSKVSDNMSLVSSLKESRWVGKFSQQIESYEKKIGKIQRALYSLNMCQRRWIYLQPILIGGALPDQLERFTKLDTTFRNVMKVISDVPKLQTVYDIQGLQNSLDTINEEQERCQKALNDYLQVKRTKFPRFYFLGDEDLLQILAQTQNPSIIQLHMKKLFAAIHSVGFSGDNKQIIEIFSIQKERVTLNQRVQLTENVEDWLTNLEKSMFVTLENCMKDYISSGTKDIKINQYPSQILCLMEEIRFSNDLQAGIKGKTLPALDSKLRHDLLSLTKLLPTVGKLQALKLKAIILDLIHHLNVVSTLLKDQKPVNLNSYNYKKNFRFTPVPEMHLFDYKYKYTFEYQGNLPKLVHTPLTDKCYITLSLALSMGLGGNPYGPAGTGKTETVKAMAMLFGRMCLVFNCDEGLDYKSMARIFLGLVRCGAWGCFDQFNRLLEEQLSAISQQIQVIQFAIKSNQTHLQLIGKKVEVNLNSGIFVTLNPAGKGYGGRSRLPDNLKQLFRPVAMSVPDNQLIAEVLLYSQGFKQAKQLAQKVICLFTLSRQLLSQQQHYDWGLRALKTILSVAGRLIFQQRSRLKGDITFETECELLIKAIRINTLSKLTFTDMRKFKFLLQDIFPGIESKDIVYEEIEKTIKLVIEEMKLSYNQAQVSKILQFYEATQQRMGVVLVGPSGCGKTTIWKVLKRCFEKMSIPLRSYLMNPKSMPRQQLLGQMNNDTREFNEGVLTVSAREVVKNPGNNWIILDGDIDPQWVESLNSVLDDNHLLTLPTGQRINFPNGTCFIFQTDSLLYASPATVSRMGMIYLNNEDINISGLIQKWLEKSPHLQDYIKTLNIETLLGYDEIVQSTLVGQVNQVLSQMNGVKSQHQFIVACIKGFTANYNGDKSAIISKVFEKFNQRCPVSSKESLILYAQGKVFRTYSTLPSEFPLDEICSQKGAVLQTAAVQSYLSVLQNWVQSNQNFIVVGGQGCGKSMLIRQSFVELRKTAKINFATMYCNSQTNANHVIQKLYQICMKVNSGSGKILRPKECARQVLYLKDINLPKPDKYQTIQLASFLQQVISHKGFYDPSNLQFVQLDDKIQIVVSMYPPSSIGRNQLTQRFTAIVKILNIDYPSNQDLLLIYTEYFRALLRDKKIDQGSSRTFATLFVEIYSAIKKNFSVDEYRHYSITPKSLLEIFKNLTLYEISDQGSLVQCIWYEFNCWYRNKVVGQQRKGKFDQMVTAIVKAQFKQAGKNDALFSFLSGKYVKVKREDYLGVLKNALIQYEREYQEITFVTLEESLGYVSSIEKILASKNNPNILMVGVSGVGRQTSLQLAALILKMEILRLPTLRQFTAREFKKEMKVIIEKVVNENKRTVLFLQDHNFSQNEFIQMINSLIISGEIPGLFGLDQIQRMPEADQIRNQYLGKSLQEGLALRIQKNLRIVISLDHRRDTFNEMCASNPALFTCNVIWFDQSSSASLRAIASELIGKGLPEYSRATIDEISALISDIHRSVAERYKTAQRLFYTLVSTYLRIYKSKSSSKKEQGLHLQKGLEKLEEAKKLVDVLSKEAFEKQKLLEVKQSQASKALIQIEKSVGQATKRRTETEDLSRDLQIEEKKIVSKKQSVQQELAEVQPLIQQAKKSVSGISSSNLNELASLPKPPEAVKNVLRVVVRIFGEYTDQWNAIKIFIKNKSFISNVLNFDPRNLGGDLRRDVQREMQKNQNSFVKEVIYRASLAAGPLADWTRAILRYSKVVETIKPLEGELNKLMKALDGSKKRVIECEEELAMIDKKVKELKGIFATKTGEAQVLKNQLERSQSILSTAKNLLSKLQDQRVRWDNEYRNIQKQTREYPIHSLIAASFITYLSDRDENQREVVLKDWKLKIKSENYNFLKYMISQGVQLKWKSQGLASDSLSIQNSVMIFNTSAVPLILDPNNQAIQWLKKSQEKMEVISQRHPKFTNSLELAVRFGKELLIQEVEDIQAILVPVIRRDLQQQGSRVVIKVGDKLVDYSSTFKLYLATRNSNIHLPSNTRALVCFINYSVTKSGLESKLLSMVINHQQPQLEHKKSELLENEDRLKSSLVKLEDQLLEELGNSSGNILENKSLLDNLTKTKSQSIKIAQSLKESEELNAKLDLSRDIYRPLSKKGALLFLKINQLNKVNNMYRFSLGYFIRLFLTCLEDGPVEKGKLSIAKKENKEKLAQAEASLNQIIYNNIASSLFKADRLTFALFLIKGVTNEITDAQWDFFTGIFPLPLENKVVLPQWANFERQEVFNHFSVALPKLSKSINFNDAEFATWCKIEEPEKGLPNCCSKLTKFQKILIILVFRPQKLQIALINFACEILNISNVSGNNVTIKHISQRQTSCDIPALFIVSTGYDPSKELQEYCEGQIGRDNYIQLSMGGGQNQVALNLMRTAAEKGQWICLKNIHLVTAWLATLQKQFRALQKKHANFKLFLTSQQHHNFPSVLLETCFKISYESPPGLKKNFLRTYQQLDTSSHQIKNNFTFVLAFFHALVQERRTYIPQGWSKSYEFSYSDLKVALEIIDNLIKQYETTKNLNFQLLYGIFEQGIYGGRIDNFSDLKVLRVYLKKYFNLLMINGETPIGFNAPIPKNQKELTSFLSKMPEIDDPSLFGLPRNIDKIVQRTATEAVIKNLKVLSLAHSEGSALNKEEELKLIAPVLKLWTQTYKQIKDAKFPTIKNAELMSQNPIESFIYLQASQALLLADRINRQLDTLDNILQGKGLMTTEIQQIVNKLINRELPKEWEEFWAECEDPSDWIRRFGRKILLIKAWVLKAQSSRIKSQEFDLAELFHPVVFINACKQNASRSKIALDKLTLVTTFQEAKSSQNAIQLKGLLLQGCSLHKNLLGPLSQKDEEYEKLPTLFVDFLSNPPPLYPNEEEFSLFSSVSRESLLLRLKLGISGESSEKIIAGTALFLREI